MAADDKIVVGKKEKAIGVAMLAAFCIFMAIITWDNKPAQAPEQKQAVTATNIKDAAYIEIRRVIRFHLHNPDFLDVTYDNQFGDVYETKYRVKVEDAYGYAFVKVKYLGGNPDDTNNWDVLETTFE